MFADAVIKLVQRGELARGELAPDSLAEAFEAAQHAKEPVRLVAMPGLPSDSRAVFRDEAGDLKLDALSLQSRIVSLLFASNPTMAADIFGRMEHPVLEARPCEDPMIADDSAYYEMAARMAPAEWPRLMAQAHSPGELASLAKSLAASPSSTYGGISIAPRFAGGKDGGDRAGLPVICDDRAINSG